MSVLFNRPIAGNGEIRSAFQGEVIANAGGLAIRRPRPVAGAAAQPDGRIVNLNFDHILSANASYEIRIGSLIDPLTSVPVPLGATIQPKIENARPAGLLYGKVLRADNSPIDGAEVALSIFSNGSLPYADSVQFDLTPPDGTFFFEFVERDTSRGYEGAYRLDAVDAAGKATSANGAVRLPGSVQFVNLVFLGRGTAEGYVRYEDGTKAAGVDVVAGSTMFNESRRTKADANGFYRIENLPVGPLTFSAADSAGRVVFAASEVRTAGAVVTQDLVIPLGEAPGTGTVRGLVIRSDTNEPVAGARVGIFSRGYAVGESYTSTDGRFELAGVPAGFVTVLAAEWSVSRTSAAQDFDLRPDATRELTMILAVRGAEALARVEGFGQREDPLHPNDPAFYSRVEGAVVRIEGLGTATADALGTFIFEGVPSSLAGRPVKAWDPSTGRAGATTLPSPLTPASSVAVLIPAKEAGKGSVRVRLLSAAGFPVDGFDVFVPGLPKTDLQRMGEGIYELRNVPAGRTEE
ncbi:MAG TPA: carboxypeptidase-like regulatory domain-containing protein, partial [Thermoanaerobaculia bacterium]|nr:carboxypeptidase-like regulatory domain-containing protein [Thermoanaerobaculia bacterium]